VTKIYTFLINELITAGLEEDSTPYFLLLDADGQPWKKQPLEMSAPDIIEYVQCRFGDLFAGFCRAMKS
jgi:hypothetical protein